MGYFVLNATVYAALFAVPREYLCNLLTHVCSCRKPKPDPLQHGHGALPTTTLYSSCLITTWRWG
jgi:hypothetical protein